MTELARYLGSSLVQGTQQQQQQQQQCQSAIRPGSHIAIGARLKALARLHTHNPLCSRMRQHQNNNKTEKSRANFSWAKVHSYSERGHCGKPFFTCAVSRYSALSGDPIQTTQIFNLSSAQRSSPRLGFACP